MFPFEDLSKRVEVSPQDFLDLVLIPESALILLQEDLGLQGKRNDGIRSLRKSFKFGLLKHPMDKGLEDIAGSSLAELKAQLKKASLYVTNVDGHDHVVEVRFLLSAVASYLSLVPQPLLSRPYLLTIRTILSSEFSISG